MSHSAQPMPSLRPSDLWGEDRFLVMNADNYYPVAAYAALREIERARADRIRA
jgi:hypothetical protein